MLISTLHAAIVVLFSLYIVLVSSERTQCGGVVSKSTGRWVDIYICPSKKQNSLENRCCDPPEYGCCREATFSRITRPEEVEHLNGTSVPCEQSADTRVYEVNTDIIYRQNKDLV